MRVGEVKISLIYLLTCCLWITASDKVLFLFRSQLNAADMLIVSSLKGVFFVFITTLLLWYLIKLNNKRLLDGERQYRSMYEGSPLAKWIYDPVTLKFISVNDTAIAQYGYTRDEFLSMSILDMRPDEDRQRVIESISQVSDQLKPSGVWRHLKRDGSEVSVAISSQQIAFNKKRHIMVTAQDVTQKLAYEQELKRLNDELREEKNKLSETQQIARVGGWEFYLENKQLIWSEEMYSIAGIEPYTTENPYDLYVQQIYPEDRADMLDALNLLITTGRKFDVIHRIHLLTGETRYIRQIAKLVHSADGKPLKLLGSAQDITELKQLEHERNKYMLNLEDTLNSINEGFYTLDHSLIFTKVNRKFEIETGLSAVDVIGKGLTDVFPGIEGRITFKQYTKAIKENIPVRFEAYWKHFKKWHYVDAYPTVDGIAVYFVDITDKKLKDMQLESAISRYETVAKATRDVIYDYDIQNDYLSFYTDVSELLNCDPNEIGRSLKWWRSHIHPDDRENVTRSQQEVLNRGETNWDCEYRIKCAGHRDYIWVFSQGYYLYNSSGVATRIVGAVKDIDALKRANEENKRLAEIITKINNMVIVMDTDHSITWANRAFEEYSGYTLEELKGIYPGDILGGDRFAPGTIEEIRRRKETLETFSIDIQHFLKDGSSPWVNVEYKPIFNDKGVHTGYMAVHQNITDRRKREEKINHQNKVLQHISWLSSHEIRRPVASILGLAYVARGSKSMEEKEQVIEMINTCAEELDGIVHNINDRISNELYAGDDSIAYEPIN
ncbi:PAS domain S-box protein [Mucilaginibacter sp. HME9299]|uniref:histidine kinase n=1 Tax=Mucilaginibacter aquatilis TaxID=1517760 RepID=A0A6I4I9R7_9SPHI|nr:PAS domain S-box protein [Mucilaginibacter aquatilis]